jgi:hypothetical protein
MEELDSLTKMKVTFPKKPEIALKTLKMVYFHHNI